VVEFARDFRNEGSDPSHMQEFSAIEHYAAWWNFEDNMRFTEAMFDYIFTNIPELKKEVEVKDKEGQIKTVNFQTPWQRIDYIAGVKEKSGIDVSLYGPQDEEKLRNAIKASGYTWEGIDNQVTATMIDYLYKKVLRPGIVGPAFVYNYPKTMQPLARQSDANPDIVEQWQLVINGWEVIKAYSELVDSEIQKANFEAQ
jgi:lysyl-tRNA synthetase, class II